MLQNETTQQGSNPTRETSSFRHVRNSVILPNGSQREPLGSGVITGLLGVGGMANVYEIWNSQLEIGRAVKLLHPNYTEETKQRFDTEIKITAKLHHANIVEIHAVGYWNDLPYIEMERIEGKTLEALVTERGAFPTEVCTAIGVMIGRALRYAHHQEYIIYGKTYHGVIHRDLKPSNIMISTRGILKLMDFGIARPTDTSIHTTDGSILGTMQYLSPEQLEGKEPDVRTDIYSMGAVLYEMITGEKAFPEKNAAHLMLSRLKNDFKTLDHFDVKIPARLKNLVHKCMIKDREKRVQDASAFLSEITRIHKNFTTLTPEQVLKQFIGTSDFTRRVLISRYHVPNFVIVSISAVVLILLVIVFCGSSIKEFFYERLDSAPLIEEVTVSPQQQVFVRSIEPVKITGDASEPSAAKKVNLAIKKSATVKQEVKELPPVSLTEQLSSFYGTTDLLKIFVEESKLGHYEAALEVFSKLSPVEAENLKARIYRMRILRALQRTAELQQMLLNEDLSDAEFYLEKARYFLDNGNTHESLKFLEFASKAPAAYIGSSTIRLERLYLTARCRSVEFDVKPSVELKNIALECWYELKVELQTSKDHSYFKEADLEMQRITQKINSSKG